MFLGILVAAAILSGLGLGLFGYVQLRDKIVGRGKWQLRGSISSEILN